MAPPSWQCLQPSQETEMAMTRACDSHCCAVQWAAKRQPTENTDVGRMVWDGLSRPGGRASDTFQLRILE